MPTPTSPGEAIRLARLICHMGQEHLALAAGVSERTVRRVEKGDAISAESMRSICATLQIDARTVGRGKSPTPRIPASAASPAPAIPLPEDVAPVFECPWRASASVRLPLIRGDAWHYAPGTSVQDCFIDIVTGPPGTGKSTLLHGASLALCGLDPQTGTGELRHPLPYVLSLDTGAEGTAWAERVRNLLPEERRFEVVTRRMSNTDGEAINPFETPLGWRRPGSSHRRHLLKLLATLVSCEAMPSPSTETMAYLGAAIDAAYRQPAPYKPGENARLDALVSDSFDKPPATWWEVVDRLFEDGHMSEARTAHGYAVPTLPRFLEVLMHNDPYDPWDEPFERRTTKIVLLQVMRSLQEFPILSGRTIPAYREARIVALDMLSVLPHGIGPAQRQCAVMYLVARSLARDFFDSKDDLHTMDASFLGFPEPYRAYHDRRIRELRGTPKRIVYDEMHRTSSLGTVRSQMLADVREGRKWGVGVAIGTQLPADIDEDFVDMATGIFLLGSGASPSPVQRGNVERRFGLTAEESARVAAGDSLAVFYTKAGRISTPFLAYAGREAA